MHNANDRSIGRRKWSVCQCSSHLMLMLISCSYSRVCVCGPIPTCFCPPRLQCGIVACAKRAKQSQQSSLLVRVRSASPSVGGPITCFYFLLCRHYHQRKLCILQTHKTRRLLEPLKANRIAHLVSTKTVNGQR